MIIRVFLLVLFRIGCTAALLQLQNNETECRLLTYIPFTDLRASPAGKVVYGYGNWPNEESLSRSAISLVAVAEMARQHFNERNPIIVPELSQLKDCAITISDESLYKDSGFVRSKTVDQIMELENNAVRQGLDKLGFCAVVGPKDAHAHAGLSAVTEHWHLPQLAYSTTNHLLSRSDLYPNFIRMIPDAADAAKSLAHAAQGGIWERDYVAIVYEPDFGEQYEDSIELYKDEKAFYQTERISPSDKDSIDQALRRVAEGGYRTIMLTMNNFDVLADVARFAKDHKVVGEGYLWIITGDALPDIMRKRLELEPGSALDMFLDGAFMFTNYDRFYYRPEDDRFLQTWRAQDASQLQNTIDRQPLRNNSSFYVEALPDDFFETEDPALFASFLYDSIIATGLAACNISKNDPQKDDYDHYRAISGTHFTGASGDVFFKHKPNGGHAPTRDERTGFYGMHNIRAVTTGDTTHRYEVVLVALYNASTGEWNKTGAEFRYAGGGNIPPRLVSVHDHNYLSTAAQSVGLGLVTIALIICAGSAAWIYKHINEPLVKASQPEFLLLLCFGSALIAVSLVFLSVDEGKGWDESQLNKACSAFPWFFLTGYSINYFALVCKMWRLSRLLQMAELDASLKHAMIPFAAVILCILVVLTVWQITDPLQWHRGSVGNDPKVSYGECSVEDESLVFILPLGALIILSMSATAFLSWKLRNIRADLAESRWIFVGTALQVQLWAIGTPLFLLADETSREGSYIMSSSLCFMFATTLVVCIIWPKMYVMYRSSSDRNCELSDLEEEPFEAEYPPPAADVGQTSLDSHDPRHEKGGESASSTCIDPDAVDHVPETVLTADVSHAFSTRNKG